jgi:hypothetical protein
VMEDLARVIHRIVNDSRSFSSTDPTVDGIVILIDEADKPPSTSGLGEFCKLFTERLTRMGCERVCLGLAGLPTLIPKLRESHGSAPRVFEVMVLEPLTRDECKAVVRRGLDLARAKEGAVTEIAEPALEHLAELSEGYPHFIQQFAYSAFDEDVDNNISEIDVAQGAFKENGALDQLGKRYFNEMYFERVWSEDYKKVLHTMTEHLDAWIPRSTIIKESQVKESQVNNALNALTVRAVILHGDQRRGEYKLPTKAFAVWIKALLAKQESLGSR